MAHHKPVSRQSWQTSQRLERCKWQGKQNFAEALGELRSSYVPLIQQHTANLPEQAEILEIGCGPVCVSHLIEQGKHTYADPLLDDFRRAYPGELPEGEYLSVMAEDIPRPDNTFDCIICINALGFVLNPELVLSEADRLLKDGGTMLVGMTLFSPLMSRLHYFFQQVFPAMCPEDRPYCYSHAGIRKTLERHFTIEHDIRVGSKKGVVPFMRNEERFFVCRLAKPSRG